MTKSILLDTHPMYAMEILKRETNISNISEIVEYFKVKM